jgi:hypothetical protein
MSSESELKSIDLSNSLVVPPPLHRQQTIQQKNLSMILSVNGEALQKFGDKQLSAGTILVLLGHIITAAQKLFKLKGDDLKQVALDSIHWLIDHSKYLSDEEKSTLDLLSETVFPQAFDMLTSVSGCSCFA